MLGGQYCSLAANKNDNLWISLHDRRIIRRCVNAGEDDIVVFAGSGTTGAIAKLIHALDLSGGEWDAENCVVIYGPFEHHSNILPWREAGLEVGVSSRREIIPHAFIHRVEFQTVRIPDNRHGYVDKNVLREALAVR